MALPDLTCQQLQSFLDHYRKGHYSRGEVPYFVLRLCSGIAPKDVVDVLPDDVLALVKEHILALPATKAEREQLVWINTAPYPDEIHENFRNYFLKET